MSDMKKLLDSLTEMATVSGSVATVSAPLGATQTRSKSKGTPSVYGEQVSETESVEKTDECDTDSDKQDGVTNNVRTPANFGLWQNSYHQAEEQKKQSKTKKSGAKKPVSEARVSDEMSELDKPEIQSAMKRMKAKYDSDPRTQDQEKFSRDLGRRLQAAASRSEKKSRSDEQLNDNRVPGGLRPLNLAEQNLDEADLIMNPFERSKKRPRGIFSKNTKQDHEVSMARSDLLQCIKNSELVIDLLSSMSDSDNIEAWVQEKIVKANDYLNTIAEYLDGKRALGEGVSVTVHDINMKMMRLLDKNKQTQDPKEKQQLKSEFQKLKTERNRLLNVDPKDTTTGELDEERKPFRSERDLASDGKMSLQMAEICRPRMEIDFYQIGTGNKMSGVVLKNDGKTVKIKTTHNPYDESDTSVQEFKIVGMNEGEDLAWDDPDLATARKMQADKKKKMAVVKPKDEIGFKIADIGPGGREHNVKTDAAWDRKHGVNEDVTDYEPKSQGGTRKELLAKLRSAKSAEERSELATRARKAGATQKELQDLSEGDGQYRGQYPSKEEAVAYAKEKIKSFRDPEDGIEIWALPSGGFDVVHTMNSNGRNHVVKNGGKKLGTVGQRYKGVAEAYDDSMTDAEWEREYQREKSEKEQARKEIQKNHVSQFKTKDEAVQYANDKLKTFKDSKIGMSVYAMPDGGFDVISTARTAAAQKRSKLISDAGGKHLGTLGPRYTKHKMAEGGKSPSPGWMLRQDPELAKKVKDAKAGYKDLKKYAGKDIPKKDVAEGNDRSDIRPARVGDEIVLKNPNYRGVIVKLGTDGEFSFKNESDGKRYRGNTVMIDRNLSQENRYKERSDMDNKRFDDAMARDMERINKSGALKKFGIGEEIEGGVAEAFGENLPPLKSPNKDDPYEQGWRTFYRRGDESDNPYERGTPEYQQWNRGFQDGEAEPNHYDESVNVAEKGPGLWANIHAKRERIKKGSGERMRKPGSKGAPSAKDLKSAQTPDKKS